MNSKDFQGPLYMEHVLQILDEMKLIKGAKDIERWGKLESVDYTLLNIKGELNKLSSSLDNLKEEVYTLIKKDGKGDSKKKEDGDKKNK